MEKKIKKRDVLKNKNIKYKKEKRLAEHFYIKKKDQILLKNVVKSFIRDSFYYRKKRIKERLIYEWKKWKNQFFFFEEKKNKSEIIKEELEFLRKGEKAELFLLKHYFLRGVLIEKDLLLRKERGLVKRIKKRKLIHSSITYIQNVGKKDRITHQLMPYSPNVIGVNSLGFGISVMRKEKKIMERILKREDKGEEECL